MTLTYLLYIIMSCVIPLFIRSIVTNNSKLSKKQWLNVSIVLCVLSIIIGGRYKVGTDFSNYVEYYESFLKGYSNINDVFVLGSSLEPGYLFLNWFAAQFKCSVSFFFTVIAYCSFLLLLKSQNNRAYLWPLILFYFFTQLFGSSMNIVRQSCAILLFFYSVQFVGNNKLKLFVLITFCVMLHYSSFVFYLALLIDSKFFRFLDNKTFTLSCFIITWLFATYVLPFFLQLIPIDILSAKYMMSLDNSDVEMEVSSGLGILLTKTIDIFLISQSDKVIAYFKDERLRYIYRLFIFGVIMANVMGISMYLSRIFLGLVMLRIYVLSFTTFYCIRQNNIKKWIGVFLLFISIMMLIMSIKNGASGMAPYKFMWR